MTPERWERVRELFHTARSLAENERPALLAEACAGDHALRREVEALLAQPLSTASFVEFLGGPPPEHLRRDHGSDLTGRRIGSYRVQALIGRGGMGEVHPTSRACFRVAVPVRFVSRRGTLLSLGRPGGLRP